MFADYTIFNNLGKMPGERYKLHEAISKASMPIMLIAISYQKKCKSCLVNQNYLTRFHKWNNKNIDVIIMLANYTIFVIYVR